MSHFYGTEYEIWAGFGPIGIIENFNLGRKVHCSKDIIDFGINLNPGWRIVPQLLEQCQDFESMN